MLSLMAHRFLDLRPKISGIAVVIFHSSTSCFIFARSDTSELMYGIWSHKIIVSQLPNVKTAWSKVQLSRLDIGGLRQTDRRTDSRTCRP